MARKDYQKIKRRQNNQKKTRFSFLFKPKFLTLVILIFIVLAFFPLAKNFSQKRVVDQEIEAIKQEIEEFQSKNQDLIEMLSYLESDSGQQEVARLNLGLKSPGEEVVVIEGLDALSSEERLEDVTKPNWQKWIDYFFNS